ncbi:hypothetical protein B0I31_105370 [Saccharothrix carnea]|uniref:Uncharacterized protein n=1 Tax=Saccharothrix carnea TaxID=1280637 RepID=A0A2P8IAC1_SACCR|nr:hypothetical protein [Saccharothrix carnea]PSL55408.1 hypothetical protein B0I31_105370 [Saccharothrix carnea]
MRAQHPHQPGGTLGLWCGGDLPGLGDQLLARVLERELTQRLGDWRVRALAPFGWTRPVRADGGHVAEPLGERTPGRVRELAESHHLHLVAPSFPLGSDLAGRYGEDVPARAFFTGGLGVEPDALWISAKVAEEVPAELVEWAARQPLASVRDEVSRERLRAAGLRHDVTVVPNPALLADRLLSASDLRTRVAQLRQLGQLPPEGQSYLVVQVPRTSFTALRPAVAKTAELLAIGEVVLLPTGGPVPDTGWRALPSDTVLEDRLAMLSGAAAVLAADEYVAAAAHAFRRRWVLFDPKGTDRAGVEQFASADRVVTRPSGLAAAFRRALRDDDDNLAPKAVHRLDEHLDAVAAEAERAFAARGGSLEPRLAALVEENRALRSAQQRLRERIVADRHVLIERLIAQREQDRERDDDGPELAEERRLHRELAERHREVLAQLDAERRELAAMRATRLFRWTRLLRAAYGKLR